MRVLLLHVRMSVPKAYLRLGMTSGARSSIERMVLYGWFTEGFATKDVQEAAMLLQEFAEH